MNMTFETRSYVLGALLGLATVHSVAAPIAIDASNLSASAGAIPNNELIRNFNTSEGYGTRRLSAAYAANSSNLRVDWQDAGSSALLRFEFDQVRSTGYAMFAEVTSQTLLFTVGPSDATYALSGRYSMTGDPNWIVSDVLLYEIGGDALFRDLSASQETIDESFKLGDVMDGDLGEFYNRTMGSLTGTLLAGRQYALYFNYFIQERNYFTNDTGATATGFLNLAINTDGDNTPPGDGTVPEPATLTLAAAALLGVVATRKRMAGV